MGLNARPNPTLNLGFGFGFGPGHVSPAGRAGSMKLPCCACRRVGRRAARAASLEAAALRLSSRRPAALRALRPRRASIVSPSLRQ